MFAEPDPLDITNVLKKAIIKVINNEIDPLDTHDQVKIMYSWNDIAIRTEKVNKI